MRRLTTTVAAILAIGCATAFAQMGGNPTTDGAKWTDGMVKGYLIKAAVEAVTRSFAFCDQVYASMADAKGVELVKFFGGQRSRLTVLDFNTGHDFEHYGNLVTYMRLKGMVPPSSQRGT